MSGKVGLITLASIGGVIAFIGLILIISSAKKLNSYERKETSKIPI